MRFSIASKKMLSWVACLAILLSAIAPAVAHAMNAGSGGAWVEICTSAGAKWVRIDAGSDREVPQPPASHLLEHCPYCALHSATFALPPAPFEMVQRLPLALDIPLLRFPAPRFADMWPPSQPRSPPLAA